VVAKDRTFAELKVCEGFSPTHEAQLLVSARSGSLLGYTTDKTERAGAEGDGPVWSGRMV